MYYSKTKNGFYPESLKNEYLSAGSFPNDAIKITEDEYLLALDKEVGATLDVIDGSLIIIPPSKAFIAEMNKPIPDLQGFIQAIKIGFGGIVEANSFAKHYPLFTDAVAGFAWDDVKALIIDAHTTSVLSNNQYAAFKDAVINNNIPVILP